MSADDPAPPPAEPAAPSAPPRRVVPRGVLVAEPLLPLPERPEIAGLVAALRAGDAVPDAAFDRLYPDPVRERSAQYWTPIEVALEAARWLSEEGPARVLDVGSGPGKFCLVAALATASTYTGVECRPHLAALGAEAARRYRVDNAHFVTGDLRTVSFRAFDAFYFYNPFAENYFDAFERYDSSVPLSWERRERDLAFVREALAAAPAGTRVVTYHGLGAPLPTGYALVRERAHGPYEGALSLWRRA